MKKAFYLRRKFWAILLSLLVLLPILIFGGVLVYLSQHQAEIVQSEIKSLNREYQGQISVGATHLAPFENFPYVSIKVDDVKVLESKAVDAPSILEVADIYIGLNLLDLLQGEIDIQKLLIEDGFFDIVLHTDGSNNLSNALSSRGAAEVDTTASEPLHFHLQDIELKNIDLHKIDESNGLDIETLIYWAKGGFSSSAERMAAHIDTEFELNIMKHGDTTFVKHKHFEFHTDLNLDETNGLLTIAPSGIVMERSNFELAGTVDTEQNMNLDLAITGTKSNFDMLISFAPNDLIPLLERYKNAGNIYFNTKLQGPAAFGYFPLVEVDFGASEAFLENKNFGRRVDQLGFEGHFSNGAKRDATTMEFSMKNMTASLEEGDFTGEVRVENFEAPEIEMAVEADFNLDFLAEFLNLTEYNDASGSVDLKMNFHDIINLDNPQEALTKLDQAYYSELTVKNLHVNSPQMLAPLENLNAHLIVKGKRAELDQFELQYGNSDLKIEGYLSDLPSLIHQREVPLDAHLEFQSKLLDVSEFSGFTKNDSLGIDERITDFSMGLSFESSAKELAQSKYLPKGEFFVDSLHAQFKHYPHELHDFHVDILIDERDLRIKDFTGAIDQSDFHLNGKVHDYAFWMQDTLAGDVDLDLGLESELLRLDDIFAYQGKNYVPEEYRHEEFDNLKLHFTSSMHYNDSGLHSIDLNLDQFDAKMHLHPMRFKDFSGRIHYEGDQLLVEDFHAQLGRTILNVDLDYYLGTDSSQQSRDNYLRLKTNYIDFDQLTNFNPEATKSAEEKATKAKTTADVEEHAEAYNLYELPFSNMRIEADIGHFIYHRIDLQDIQARLRTTQNHYLYVDTLNMKGAGGEFLMNGYFNGSDPEHIYLKPNLQVNHVNLDQLLFKFENFGQDVIVSENLHGQLTASVTGNIRIYPDFVPDLDQSEVHMDILALNGRLEDYDYLLMLSDYFGDKDLTSVRFDTLQNHIDVKNGVLTIPNMTIESTLGHMEIAGKQELDGEIEYYLRIPWKMIKEGARYRVFGSRKKDKDDNSPDEIVKVDPDDKTRYLNLKVTGTLDDYKIRPGKLKGEL
ncbi:MAG: AsmA-like C-terminal region-containing protein [Vicingaceae bacterium]